MIFFLTLLMSVRNILQIYKIVNKKLPRVLAQGSFYIFLTDLFRKIIFNLIVKDHLFFKTICTCLG